VVAHGGVISVGNAVQGGAVFTMEFESLPHLPGSPSAFRTLH
jgi:hypothetical protein